MARAPMLALLLLGQLLAATLTVTQAQVSAGPGARGLPSSTAQSGGSSALRSEQPANKCPTPPLQPPGVGKGARKPRALGDGGHSLVTP